MDDSFVFPEGWSDLRGDTAARDRIEQEVRREVAPGHVLAGAQVRAVAACWHCDDVLLDLLDGRFAAVHLSYPAAAPDRPPWPTTEIFDGWAQATAYVEDHAAYA